MIGITNASKNKINKNAIGKKFEKTRLRRSPIFIVYLMILQIDLEEFTWHFDEMDEAW